uniref:Glycosyl transferase family 25 domain-containing protein n=1 Tax=viral metagenome TaxID=1070528 RepID=A0A6C0BSQ7_9ZZZZ
MKTDLNINLHTSKNMKFLNIDHIYVVHCKQYPERYTYLQKIFDTLNIPKDYYDFVVHTHKSDMTDETVLKYYTVDTDIRDKELKIIGENTYLTKDISRGNISCGINHINIWQKVTETEYNNVLVLEDDIIFQQDTIKNLVEATMQLPKKFSFCSLEEGAGLKVTNYITKNIDQDVMFYKVPDGRMRCTGSYITNKETCRRLLTFNTKRKFSLEIDMQLWLYGKLKLIDVYWAYPPVFVQGSQNGTYVSGIQNTNGVNESHNVIIQNTQRLLEYLGMESNRRCIEIKNDNDQQIYSRNLIERHNFSTLTLSNNDANMVNKMKEMNKMLSIKHVHMQTNITNDNIAHLIKENYFEGALDILVLDKYDKDLLFFLLTTSIIINPKIIIITSAMEHTNIHESYTYCNIMNMFIKK